uniref:Uncharacterized protein n=1 Tax=Rhipicephalus microplus TaxID=6941 RepID=A0A6G4ZUA9_RHIMP
MQKIGTDIDHLKSTSEDTKDKVGLDEVVAEVSNLKMKFEDIDAIEESLQETKDGFLRINILSVELDKIREKIDKLEQSEVINKDTAKKLEEATTQLSSMQTVNDSIQRLQNSLQTLNKRFIKRLKSCRQALGLLCQKSLKLQKSLRNWQK